MMHPLTSAARYALLALCVLPPTACAMAAVGSYANHAVDLSRYRTYAWGPADAGSTGDPRLDNNRFFDERVRRRVEARLSAQGFEKTEAATPDLLVHYHASFSQKIDVREMDLSYASSVMDRQPVVYDAGTLFVDLVDTRAKTLVWRGWAEGSMEGAIDDQAALEARVDDAVMRILRRLPPAPPRDGTR